MNRRFTAACHADATLNGTEKLARSGGCATHQGEGGELHEESAGADGSVLDISENARHDLVERLDDCRETTGQQRVLDVGRQVGVGDVSQDGSERDELLFPMLEQGSERAKPAVRIRTSALVDCRDGVAGFFPRDVNPGGIMRQRRDSFISIQRRVHCAQFHNCRVVHGRSGVAERAGGDRKGFAGVAVSQLGHCAAALRFHLVVRREDDFE